jgi:hypothetical protein
MFSTYLLILSSFLHFYATKVIKEFRHNPLKEQTGKHPKMASDKGQRSTEAAVVYANVQKRGKYVVLAICDAELLGRVLCEGEIVFRVSEAFYKGSRMSVEEAITLVETSTIVNLVGRQIIKKAIAEGLVHPEAILNISGVPHAQIVKM